MQAEIPLASTRNSGISPSLESTDNGPDTVNPVASGSQSDFGSLVILPSLPATPQHSQLDDTERSHLPVGIMLQPSPTRPIPASTAKQIVASRSFRRSKSFQPQHFSRSLRRPSSTSPLVQTEVSTERTSNYRD